MSLQAHNGKNAKSRIDDLSVVIQAGGESRRMGSSKALVPFLGKPLICRVVDRLSAIAGELVITTNEVDQLEAVARRHGWDGVRLVPDELEARGALNGLYTALKNASKPFVAVVACDMVFASAPLLAFERGLLTSGDEDAAIPRTSHGFEPFHAVYRRQTCLPLVAEAIKSGEHKAQSWYGKARLRLVSRDEVLKADPRGGAFANVNTPQELYDMERRIRSGGIGRCDGDAAGGCAGVRGAS